MPTLENSRAPESLKNPNLKENPADLTRRNGVPKHLYISPALYVTPEQAPIPESPSPGLISPSPYVANQKRRRGRIERRSDNVVETGDLALGNDGDELDLEEAVGDNFGNGNLAGDDDDVDGDDEEGFLDRRSEAMSLGSEVEAVELGVGSQLESRSFVSAQGDYFDANDEFSSDSCNSNIPSHSCRVESELHATKLSILDEIERRKAAEEMLMVMQCQWGRICSLMSKAGLSFPEPPASGNMLIDNDSIDHFSEEILVTRFVAEAIGRGEARADAEEAAALIIESKDQELMRLRDRLQYYETVNHELSQRKLVEAAQRQQHRKQKRRWAWGLAGLAIAVGATFVAYSCIQHTGRSLLTTEFGDPTDVPNASISNSEAP